MSVSDIQRESMEFDVVIVGAGSSLPINAAGPGR
jgi:ribulose 1,5-bisphosphate synthetase/thiazole synthase